MTTLRSLGLSGIIALCSLAAVTQEVHVTSANGMVTLSVMAQRAYTLTVGGQPKTPVLTVSCQQKGKNTVHSVMFSPVGILTEQEYSTFGNSASLALTIKLAEQKLSTNWIAYGSVETFTYYGKTEQERLALLHALLSATDIAIEFTDGGIHLKHI